MPYVKRAHMSPKKDRIEKNVALVGISVPESAEISREKQIYKYLDCAFQQDDMQYLHVTVSPPMGGTINLKEEEFAFLAKLDALSRAKAHCQVHIQFYQVKKAGKDKSGADKVYTNFRASMSDVAKWRVL